MSVNLVDIHTHILPPHLPDFGDRFGYGTFISVHEDGDAVELREGGEFFRRVDRRLIDPEVRIEAAAACGVATQVLSPMPAMFCYWTKPEHGAEIAAFVNDHIATVVSDHPERFVGLGTLPMQDSSLAIRELERCMTELGLAGIEIGTNVCQRNLSEPQTVEVLAAAADLGAAVFVHPWDMMGAEHLDRYWLPWLVAMPAETSRAICSLIFGGVFEQQPDLRVAFAHGGGSFPATFGRIEHGFRALPDYVGVDNPHPPSRYLGRFWVDSVVHDPGALRLIVDLLGQDRVCVGSDFPFRLGEDPPGASVEAAGLDAGATAAIGRDNALDWLGIAS